MLVISQNTSLWQKTFYPSDWSKSYALISNASSKDEDQTLFEEAMKLCLSPTYAYISNTHCILNEVHSLPERDLRNQKNAGFTCFPASIKWLQASKEAWSFFPSDNETGHKRSFHYE